MSNIPQVNEIPPSTADRRAHPREKMCALAYVDLGPANGGMLLNLSEGGLALATASRLVGDELSDIHFELPDVADRIEVCGRVAWRGESRKEAGIKFVELSPAAAEAIREWISSQQRREQEETESQSHANVESPVVYDVTDPALPSREIRPAQAETAPESRQSAPEATAAIAGDRSAQRVESGSSVGSPSTTDRRAHARGMVTSLAYVDLGLGNGGRLLNLSESGLALTAIVKVMGTKLERLRFELPNFEDWVEARARIIWRNESQKQVGVQFEKLSDEALAKIREWVSAEGSGQDVNTLPAKNEEAEPQAHPDFQQHVALDAGTSSEAFTPAALEPIVAPAPSTNLEPSVIAPRLKRGTRRETPAVTGAKNLTSFAVITACVAVISFVAGIAIERRVRAVPPESAKVAAALKQKAQSIRDTHASRSDSSASPQVGATNPGTVNSPPSSTITSSTKTQPPASASVPITVPTTALKSATAPARTQKSNVASLNPDHSAGKQPGPQKQTNSVASNASAPKASNPMRGTSLDVHHTDAARHNAETEANRQSAAPPQTVTGPKTQTPPKSDQPTASRSASPDDTSQPTAANNTLKSDLAPASANTPPNVTPSAVAVKPSITITMAPFPSLRIPAQSTPEPSRLGKSLEIGQLVSRVEPVYPAEAASERIEGTVKIHATIGRDGTIQSIVANGPRLLAEAAKKAVEQWRYRPTLVGGQAIEADQDIVVVFRLSPQGSGSN